MSIRAMNWAMEQATGDPRAQCLLYVVADTANEEGVAWPSADWMAKKSQQSRATVYRRLGHLQELGLLVLLPRWIDDEGKIFNAAAPGRRRTSPEIRLQFGVFIKQDEPPHDDGEGLESPAPLSQVETTPVSASDGAISPVRRGSSHCGDNNHHLNPQEDSPPCPPAGGVMVQPDGLEEKTWPGAETWPSFERAWQEPILRQSIARNVWSGLTDDERKLATRAAAGYVVWRAQQKKPPNVINAHTFLRERDAWRKFAAYAAPEPKAKVRVEVGTPAWRGRCVIARIWNVPEPAGPLEVFEDAVRYLASLAPLHDQVGDGALITESENRKQVHAWQQRLAHCGTRMPDPRKIETGEEHPVLGPVWRLGWLVPCEWPPRMDGTLSSTGPPTQSLMTREDEQELARDFDERR